MTPTEGEARGPSHLTSRKGTPMKRFIFAPALVLLLSLPALAQVGLNVMLPPPRVDLKRLRNSTSYSTWVGLGVGNRDTSMAFYVGNSGGIFAAQCSVRIKAAGTLTIGYLLGMSGINSKLVLDAAADTSIVLSSHATSGYKLLRASLPGSSYMALTFSNHGTDSVYFKFDPPAAEMFRH